MTRNFKALGLALVAVIALSAVTASAAQAKFTWDSGTQKLTAQPDGAGSGTGLQSFTTTSGPVQCQGVTGEAAVSGTSATEVTAQNIKYQPCTDPFGGTAQVNFGQCDYLFTAGQTINNNPEELTGQAHVKCVSGGQITITALSGFCQIHVPQQSPGGHVIYRTITGSPDHVTMQATVTGIVYQGTGLCTSGNAGTYNGNVLIKGENGQTPTGVRTH